MKLNDSSLSKYRTIHKLTEAAADCSKEELIPHVAKHFAAQQVWEIASLRVLPGWPTLRQDAPGDKRNI